MNIPTTIQRSRMRLGRLRAWMRRRTGWIPRPVRRIVVSVIGGTLLLLALAGMILPVMPGVIFVPFGLAILALEFAWAARWLKKVKRSANNVRTRMRSGWNGKRSGATPAVVSRPDAKAAAIPPVKPPSQHNAAA